MRSNGTVTIGQKVNTHFQLELFKGEHANRNTGIVIIGTGIFVTGKTDIVVNTDIDFRKSLCIGGWNPDLSGWCRQCHT